MPQYEASDSALQYVDARADDERTRACARTCRITKSNLQLYSVARTDTEK